LFLGLDDSTLSFDIVVQPALMRESSVSYEQYFVVGAESAEDALDFVFENMTRASIESTEKNHYRSENSFIGFDEENKQEYYRDDTRGLTPCSIGERGW
jgi:hypothetical protein